MHLFTKDRTDEILRRHLDGDFFVAAAGAGAPSKQQLTQLADRFGCRLPKEFLVHATGKLGGVYVEVKASVWPRPGEYEVGPFWTFLYGVFVFGLGPEVPEWMNMEQAAADFEGSTGHRRIPCLKVVGDADFYVFDEAGNIQQWQHETDEFEPFAGTFFDLLEREIRELRQRKDRKVSGNEAESL